MPQNDSQQIIFFFPISQRRERLILVQKVDPGPNWGGDECNLSIEANTKEL